MHDAQHLQNAQGQWQRIHRLMAHVVLVEGFDGHEAWHLIGELTIPGQYPWRLNRACDGILSAASVMALLAQASRTVQGDLDCGMKVSNAQWVTEFDRLHDVESNTPF